MKSLAKNILILAILGAGIYAFRAPIAQEVARLQHSYTPCAQPIAYSLGAFDSRFGISKADLLDALAQAEAIWEKPSGRDLFAYAPDGALKVNLVYDSRQAATEKLKSLGYTLGDDRATYDTLKQKYDELTASYKTQKAAYDAQVAAFNQRSDAYKQEVADWNARGGAPRDVYRQLNAEQQALAEEFAQVKDTEASLNGTVDQINALAQELNRLVGVLNLQVDQFNSISQQRGEEFTEGLYVSDNTGDRIDIYEFSTKAQLVRVLAHELGHALGLDHVADPKAIMYKFNTSSNEKLTEADLSALAGVCGAK